MADPYTKAYLTELSKTIKANDKRKAEGIAEKICTCDIKSPWLMW